MKGGSITIALTSVGRWEKRTAPYFLARRLANFAIVCVHADEFVESGDDGN